MGTEKSLNIESKPKVIGAIVKIAPRWQLKSRVGQRWAEVIGAAITRPGQGRVDLEVSGQWLHFWVVSTNVIGS